MPNDITYPPDYRDKVGYYDLLDLIAKECLIRAEFDTS